MAGLELRVYKVEEEEQHRILCDFCAQWIRDSWNLTVEEVIAGSFHVGHCEECGKN